VYILGGVDDVLAVLEDSLVAVATISASRFVVGIRWVVYACDIGKPMSSLISP
jgi:hypothetical protein